MKQETWGDSGSSGKEGEDRRGPRLGGVSAPGLRRVPALRAAPRPQLCSPRAGISFWAHCPRVPGCPSGSGSCRRTCPRGAARLRVGYALIPGLTVGQGWTRRGLHPAPSPRPLAGAVHIGSAPPPPPAPAQCPAKEAFPSALPKPLFWPLVALSLSCMCPFSLLLVLATSPRTSGCFLSSGLLKACLSSSSGRTVMAAFQGRVPPALPRTAMAAFQGRVTPALPRGWEGRREVLLSRCEAPALLGQESLFPLPTAGQALRLFVEQLTLEIHDQCHFS